MTLKSLVAALWLALVILFSNEAAAADDFRFRIAVDVSCDDAALRSQLTSFINRELRALRDVDITDSSPNYKVSIVAIAVALRSGYNVGNAVSVVITSPVGDWTWALSNTLRPETKKAVADILAKQYSLDDHRLLVGSVDVLQQQITRLVAEFDANTLEPSRRFRQQLRDAANEKK